jgi:hypothetical protein
MHINNIDPKIGNTKGSKVQILTHADNIVPQIADIKVSCRCNAFFFIYHRTDINNMITVHKCPLHQY